MSLIYRALECTLYGSTATPVTVWFQSNSEAEATDKVRRLLAIAWDVSEDDVCMGNVDSELALQDESLLELEPKKARWFIVGSWGEVPYFDAGPQMVLLDGLKRQHLDAAREAAVAIARVWAERLQAREYVPPGCGSDEIDYHLEDLAAFVAGR